MAKLTVEMANTPLTLAQGLMGRKELPVDNGMLFKFPSSQEISFWGKNTYIPLDIAFVDNNNKIINIKQITPMSTKLVHSDGFCSMAIEANSGFFRNNKIEPGHQIKISGDTIEFC